MSKKAVERLRKRHKDPASIVRFCVQEAHTIDKEGNSEKQIKKACDNVGTGLAALKLYLYGDEGAAPRQTDIDVLVDELVKSDALPILLNCISDIMFEARKDFVTVFNNVLKKETGGKLVIVDYILQHPDMVDTLIDGLDEQDIAFNCGSMLRECLHYEPIARGIILGPRFYEFFGFVQSAQFDVASDAFSTFKDLLTTHKALVANFLEKNYDEFMERFGTLLNSDNYVTKRQSLKLLGELLLDRANFNIMTRYISDKENLKLMMTLLRAKSRNIQFEAFHVFKVFVANPNKPPAILHILVKNKTKMIQFLTSFHNDRAKEDEQFAEEKNFLVTQVQSL